MYTHPECIKSMRMYDYAIVLNDWLQESTLAKRTPMENIHVCFIVGVDVVADLNESKEYRWYIGIKEKKMCCHLGIFNWDIFARLVL